MKILPILIILLLIPITVQGYGTYSTTEFNVSANSVNITHSELTYNGDILYIKIPRRAHILNGTVTFIGFPFNGTIYQETENAQRNSGNWDPSFPYANTRDNNWNTAGKPSPFNIVYSYRNFTFPDGYLTSTVIDSSHYYVSGSGNRQNYSIIDTNCFNGPILRYRYQARENSDYVYLQCWNTTAWSDINTTTTDPRMYDDSVYWNISTYPRNVTLDLRNDGTNEHYLDLAVSNTTTLDYATMNSYLTDNCSAVYSTGYCYIPIATNFTSHGTLQTFLSSLNYTYYVADLTLSSSSNMFIMDTYNVTRIQTSTRLSLTEDNITEGLVYVYINDTNQKYMFHTNNGYVNDSLHIYSTSERTNNFTMKVAARDFGGSSIEGATIRVFVAPLIGGDYDLVGQLYTSNEGEGEISIPLHRPIMVTVSKSGYETQTYMDFSTDIQSLDDSTLYVYLYSGDLSSRDNNTIVFLNPQTNIIQSVPVTIRIAIATSSESTIEVKGSHGGSYDTSLEDSCENCQLLNYIKDYNANESLTIEIYRDDVLIRSITYSIEGLPSDDVDIFGSSTTYAYYQGFAFLYILLMIGFFGIDRKFKIISSTALGRTRFFALTSIGMVFINPYFIYVALTGVIILFKDLTDYLRRD